MRTMLILASSATLASFGNGTGLARAHPERTSRHTLTEGCFVCDSYDSRHYDYWIVYANDKHGGGGYHAGNGSFGDCGAAHEFYGDNLTTQLSKLQHLSDTDDERLLAAFLETEHAVLNPERQALQVLSGTNVVLHLPLRQSQFTQLASAAAEMKGTRVNGGF